MVEADSSPDQFPSACSISHPCWEQRYEIHINKYYNQILLFTPHVQGTCLLFSKNSVNIKIAVLLIPIGFNVKSGPGSRETKCASIADLDPDPGQTLPSQKVEILHGKIYFMKVPAGFRIWIRFRMDPHWFELLDPDPDPHSNCGSGSGSRRAKMTHKNRNKSRIFMFLSTGCSLLRAEGFSCSLGVLYGGLGISKLQFLKKKE
jgi:hypothetical protein